MRELGWLPEAHGVYISRWHHGSPSHRYGLYALHWILEVNGTATPDIDTFLKACAGREGEIGAEYGGGGEGALLLPLVLAEQVYSPPAVFWVFGEHQCACVQMGVLLLRLVAVVFFVAFLNTRVCVCAVL